MESFQNTCLLALVLDLQMASGERLRVVYPHMEQSTAVPFLCPEEVESDRERNSTRES